MLRRTRVFLSLVSALLVGLLLAPATDAKPHSSDEYFASFHTWLNASGDGLLGLRVEAAISPTTERGVHLSVYQYPLFSASCSIQPERLTIARSLKHASMSAACEVQNEFEFYPIPHQMQFDVSWVATGKKERNQDNGGIGRAAHVTITVRVIGPSGDVIHASTTVAGGYLTSLPVQ